MKVISIESIESSRGLSRVSCVVSNPKIAFVDLSRIVAVASNTGAAAVTAVLY